MLHFIPRNLLKFNVFLNIFIFTFFTGAIYGQSFQSRHLSVLKVGDGTGLSNSAQPISVIEFDTLGVATGLSLTLPYSGTAPFITSSGSATSEGQMALSAERDRLVMAGYNAATGTPTVASTSSAAVSRTVFVVFPTGTYSLAASTSSLFTANNVRSATAFGSDYFAGGAATGCAIVAPVTPAALASPVINTRAVKIFNGQTYISSGSSPHLGVNTLGTGIPTTCCQAVTLLNSPTSPSAYGFSFSPDGTVMYITDDNTGISKYTKSGATYNFAYVVNATNARSLTVDYSELKPVIYATTATTSTSNAIIKIIDNGAGSVSDTIGSLSPLNTVYRSIEFSPSCGATISLLSASSICIGNSASLQIKGNPYGVVTYNINGVTTHTTTITPNGFDTISTGPLTVNSTINLVSITTPGCSVSPISGSATVNVFSAFAVTSINVDPAVCAGDVLHMNATIGSSTGPYNYLWTGPSSYTASTLLTSSLTNSVTVTAAPASPANPVYSLTVTDANSCAAYATVTATVNPLPIAYTVNGTGGYCADASGRDVTLSNSETGVNYQLYNTSGMVGTVMPGTTGSIVDFSIQSAGTYTVSANNPTTGCNNNMSGAAIVTVTPLPAVITGTMTACSGLTITLTDATTGGTWNSGTASVATIGSVNGILMGGTAGTTIITYTALTTCTITATVTVNPLSPILGNSSVCVQSADNLSDVTSGGTWSSSNTGFGTINTLGSLSGLSQGATTISYVLPTGCTATSVVTVNPLPGIINGTLTVCYNATTSLSDGATGGTWSSGSPSFATVDPTTGTVFGTGVGISVITYTLPTSCLVSAVVTVDQLPASISGIPDVCPLQNITLSDVTTGGVWSSSNTTNGTVGAVTGIVSGLVAGTTTISYTSTVTGCSITTPFTVNPLPANISGTLNVCAGLNTDLSDGDTGGTWTSSSVGFATIGSGNGFVHGVMAGTSTITYTLPTSCSTQSVVTVNPLPQAITGATSVCSGTGVTLSDVTTGGTWSSNNTGIATVDGSGDVTGVTGGVVTITITYTILATGCNTTFPFTVNPTLGVINGASAMCAGTFGTLSDAATGGTWTSSNSGFASIGSSNGFVSAIMGGTTTITYGFSTGCQVSEVFTVNSLPAAISGVMSGCSGYNTSLSDITTDGTWSSSNTAVASIGSLTGAVTTASFGTITITYTMPSGCYTTVPLTVNPFPSVINGNLSVCQQATTLLSDGGGGTWTSGNTAIATINSGGLVTGVVAGAVTGTAAITYTLPTTCAATAIVTVYPLPAVVSGVLGICPGAMTSLSDISTGGTWASLNATVATIGSSGIVTAGSTSGTSIIDYTLSGTGCTASATVTVYQLPANISGNASVCIGYNTYLTDATTGGTWNSDLPGTASIGTSSGIVTGNISGTATITYLAPTGCSTDRVVTVNAVPGSILGTATLCPQTTTSLSDLNTGGTWSCSPGTTATINMATGLVNGLIAGNAIVTYTTSTGCYATAIITVNPLPSAIAGNPNICIDLTTSLTDVTTGGAWSSSAPLTASVGTGAGIVTGNNTGTATITYTIPTGCMITDVVVVNSLPANISGTLSVCEGTTTSLSDANSGGSWTSDNISIATISGFSGIVIGITPNTTTITYTSPAGCTTTSVLTVNPLPLPVLGTLIVCPGLSTGLSDVTTGGTWSSSNTAVITVGSNTGTVTGVATGAAYITYTISTGCIETTIVTVAALPAAISGTMEICNGTTTTLSDSPSDGTWSTTGTNITIDGTTGTITGIAAGTAIVTYTNSGSCITTATVTIDPLPDVVNGDTLVCTGLNTSLTDAVSGGVWSATGGIITIGSSTGIVTGNTAGTAMITYTLPTGCNITTGVTVNPLPLAIVGFHNVCIGATASLLDFTSGGTWSIAPGLPVIATIDGVTGSFTGVAAGTATATYTLPTGCIVTATITVNPLPAAISGLTQVCAGSVITITDATSGGTWISGNTAQAAINITTGTLTGISAGTPAITYKLSTGCIATTLVTVNPLPAVVSGNHNVCLGATTSLSDAAAGGTWSIAPAGTATIGISSGIVTGNALGTATVTYILSTGCTTTAAVTVNPYPKAIDGNGIVCQGFSITLSDSTAGGNWSSGSIGTATVNATSGAVTGMLAGTVNISYTSAAGCSVTKTVTVNPLYPISGNMNICTGSPATLTDVAGGGTWTSSTPAVATIGSSSGVITGIAPGNTLITYFLNTGCIAMASVSVNVLPATYDVTGGGSYCESGTGLHIGLNGSDTGISYHLFRSTTPMGILAGTGTSLDFGVFTTGGSYTVLGVNAAGCSGVMLGSAVINVIPTVIPSVSINALPGLTVCTGTAVTFTATAVNGGTTPLYQWHVNNTVVAAGSSYGYVPSNGDSVSIKLTSDAVCVSPDTAAAWVRIATASNLTTSVSLSVSPGDSVCPGTSVTVTPAPVNGGGSPAYTWVRNGIGAGSGSTYTFMPGDGDNIFCWMHSSITCAVADSVHSTNNINMNVPPVYIPNVVVTAYPGTHIIAGQVDTLVAVATFAGPGATYQWTLNSIAVPGATTDTFMSSSLVNNDVVTCQVTSHSGCGSATRSASVTITEPNTTGIIEAGQRIANLRLIPNPNNGLFTITGTAGNGSAAIEVTDLLGQVVYKEELMIPHGKISKQIQLTNVANGMYLLSIRSGADNKVIHFVVGQ